MEVTGYKFIMEINLGEEKNEKLLIL